MKEASTKKSKLIHNLPPVSGGVRLEVDSSTTGIEAIQAPAAHDCCTGLPDFLGTKYQNGEKYTKRPQNMYTKWP
jgi:hypothetical protein